MHHIFTCSFPHLPLASKAYAGLISLLSCGIYCVQSVLLMIRVLNCAGQPVTEKEGRSASAPLPSIAAPDRELQDMSRADKSQKDPAAAPAAARHPTVSVSPSMPVMHAKAEAEEVIQ